MQTTKACSWGFMTCLESLYILIQKIFGEISLRLNQKQYINIIAAVKCGGGVIMVWVCFAALGLINRKTPAEIGLHGFLTCKSTPLEEL